MKKSHRIIMALTAFCCIFITSCKADKYAAPEDLPDYGEYTDGVQGTDDYTEIYSLFGHEDKYEYISDDGADSRIVCLMNNDYIIRGNRMFFSVTRDGDSMTAYIDLNSGEMLYLCPDPLCSHADESVCAYLNLQQIVFVPDSLTEFYTVKTIFGKDNIYAAIYLADIDKGTLTEVYKPDLNEGEAQFISLRCAAGKALYFTATTTVDEINDSGERVRTDKVCLNALDIDMHEVKQIDSEYSSGENVICIYADESFIYFLKHDAIRNNSVFYAVDTAFESIREIYRGEDGYIIRNLYCDEAASEFYLGVFPAEMSGVSGKGGCIYRIDDNLNCEKIEPPSDKMIDFNLTEKYIYYTVYDPIIYGTSPRGGVSTVESGNKIYRASRSEPDNGTQVFDGCNEIFFNMGYIVTGNHIYIDLYGLVENGGMTWFRRSGSTVRVDYINKTVKFLEFK